MKLIDAAHGAYVHGRRVSVLARRVAPLLPEGATVLDVGCGDGEIASALTTARPDVTVEGIDVLVRPSCRIPVTEFDGRTIPHADRSFDVVLIVDVIHHADDGAALVREAARTARRALIVKDHLSDGFLAVPTLAFMDHVGNARHGVPSPGRYWTRKRWDEAFAAIGAVPEVWISDLGLYPPWADWLFGRSLHFLAKLTFPDRTAGTE